MLVPAFTIKEPLYADITPSETSAFSSLGKTFKNKEFQKFVCSDVLYFIALTLFQTGLPFYITKLMGLPDSMSQVKSYAVAASEVLISLKQLFQGYTDVNEELKGLRATMDSATGDVDRANKQLVKLQIIMNVINQVTTLPVLRPLVCYDKVEIIDLARKIGTYETSILPFEDCCTIFDPKNPVTKPTLKKCEYYEAKFDYASLIQKAVDEVEDVMVEPSQNEEDFL
jgi:Thiamine biosynthesis ATP pyrophosphatase